MLIWQLNCISEIPVKHVSKICIHMGSAFPKGVTTNRHLVWLCMRRYLFSGNMLFAVSNSLAVWMFPWLIRMYIKIWLCACTYAWDFTWKTCCRKQSVFHNCWHILLYNIIIKCMSYFPDVHCLAKNSKYTSFCCSEAMSCLHLQNERVS